MMIAVATTTTQSGSFMNNLPINWFDVGLLVVLIFGMFRGRKNGMTKEIVPTIQWIILVVASGLAYGLLATVYVNTCSLNKLWAGILAYLTIALVVFFIFSAIKKVLAPRLTGSNMFGGMEYYAGMLSGMIRYTCIVIFALALLNARSYSAAEILQQKIYNARWYGGGIYSGDYLPSLNNVQDTVFKESFTGPYIKNYLAVLLIQTGSDNGAPGVSASQPKAPTPIIHIGS